jgi:hypothetical protein
MQQVTLVEAFKAADGSASEVSRTKTLMLAALPDVISFTSKINMVI